MKVTVALLKRKGACATQAALFKELFPKGVEITEEVCVNVADKFNWSWAAEKLLSEPANAAYERATALAYAAYERATAPAPEAYERATALAYEEYRRATAPAYEEYRRATALAYAAYQRVQAATFGRLASRP